MGTIASQIISPTIVYSIVYSDADQRKHQSSASLAFVRGVRRGPVNSPHKWPLTRKMFPFDDVIMLTDAVTTSFVNTHKSIIKTNLNSSTPKTKSIKSSCYMYRSHLYPNMATTVSTDVFIWAYELGYVDFHCVGDNNSRNPFHRFIHIGSSWTYIDHTHTLRLRERASLLGHTTRTTLSSSKLEGHW